MGNHERKIATDAGGRPLSLFELLIANGFRLAVKEREQRARENNEPEPPRGGATGMWS
ncbi:hypothetical protein K2P56_03640 [Patescibacteria group bacterium]|nr:hypothetical protein [Patescibacteria group bacterium]